MPKLLSHRLIYFCINNDQSFFNISCPLVHCCSRRRKIVDLYFAQSKFFCYLRSGFFTSHSCSRSKFCAQSINKQHSQPFWTSKAWRQKDKIYMDCSGDTKNACFWSKLAKSFAWSITLGHQACQVTFCQVSCITDIITRRSAEKKVGMVRWLSCMPEMT